MNHKRKRPKNRRAGCLMCKPWKSNGMKGSKQSKRRAEIRADEQMQEWLDDLEVLDRWYL